MSKITKNGHQTKAILFVMNFLENTIRWRRCINCVTCLWKFCWFFKILIMHQFSNHHLEIEVNEKYSQVHACKWCDVSIGDIYHWIAVTTGWEKSYWPCSLKCFVVLIQIGFDSGALYMWYTHISVQLKWTATTLPVTVTNFNILLHKQHVWYHLPFINDSLFVFLIEGLWLGLWCLMPLSTIFQ